MADFDLAKERAKFLGVFPNAHWTDGATCPDQTWAINTWQGWLAARRQHGSAAQAVGSNQKIAAQWQRMMLDQRLRLSDSKEPPKGWTGPVAAAISYRKGYSAHSEFGPWEPTTLGHGCVIALRGDDDKRVKFLYDTAPPVGCANNTQPVADAEGVSEAIAAARAYLDCVNENSDVTLDFATADANTKYDRVRSRLQKALSRRPAAAAEPAMDDCSDCEGSGRISPVELCQRCNESGILPAPAEVAAEQPAAEPELLPLPEYTVTSIRDAVGQRYQSAEMMTDRAAMEFATLVAAHLRAAGQGKDSERLDFLDSEVVGYGFEGEHEGNRWMIDGPYRNIRAAIDAAMKAGAQGGGNV